MKPEDFVYVAPDGARYEMIHCRARPWWKNGEEYDPILNWEPSKIAWEFLRRNPSYFKDYYQWKWIRSNALMAGVGEKHPLWKKQVAMGKKFNEKYGLDNAHLPPSPDSSNHCPLFKDQLSPRLGQIITTMDGLKRRSDHNLEALVGEIFIVPPGGSWPRRRHEKPVRRAHRRQQLITYLRILDADAVGAPSEIIRTYIPCYQLLLREAAQKRLDNHRRAARRMMTSGYRLLAASP